jgi:hypothetical protein
VCDIGVTNGDGIDIGIGQNMVEFVVTVIDG